MEWTLLSRELSFFKLGWTLLGRELSFSEFLLEGKNVRSKTELQIYQLFASAESRRFFFSKYFKKNSNFTLRRCEREKNLFNLFLKKRKKIFGC